MSTETEQREQLAQIGQLTARLLHDTRNQLGGLKLYLAFLQKKIATLPDHADADLVGFRQAATDVIEKMNRSINALAEQSSLVSQLSKPLLRAENPVSVARVFQQVTEEIQLQTSAREISIRFQMPDAPAEIPGDSIQMTTALRLLVAEAVRLARNRSTIDCQLNGNDNALRLRVHFLSDEPLAVDDGLNFFDPLSAERPDVRILGLALAKKIIQFHQGTVALARENDHSRVMELCFAATV